MITKAGHAAFVETLSGILVRRVRERSILRVAVSGVDGAGKTQLADTLASAVEHQGVPVIRASIDSFHNPRARRYARGKASAEGFYRDSFDLTAFRRELLEPLGPSGNRTFRLTWFDYRNDSPDRAGPLIAPPMAVLIVDGIFLLRPELAECWDLTIHLSVPFDISFARMASRDGSDPDPMAPGNDRYRDGQNLYFAESDPENRADIVVDYADFAEPRIVRKPS